MSESLPDPELDAQLRGVPLPPDLLARLRATATWDDAQLDLGLRQVELPPALLATLRGIPAELLLDARLRAAPGEAAAMARVREYCRAIPAAEDLRSEPASAGRPAADANPAAAASPRLPIPAADGFGPASSRAWPVLAGLVALVAVALYGAWHLAHLRYALNDPDFTWIAIRIDADDCANDPNCEDDSLLPLWLAQPEIVPAGPPREPASPPIALVAQEPPALPESAREFAAVLASESLAKTKLELLFPETILGEPQRSEVPELQEVAPWVPRGAAVPTARGFDRHFLWRYGVHPLVSPAANPALAVSEAPLSALTASFDQLRTATARGELPPATTIFVEDFLAAVDSPFPPARPGRVELRTAAGPAIFALQRPVWPGADPQPRLLQVQVETGPVAARAQPATYLTIALDVSARMRWGGRLEECQRAILAAARQLGPRDRLAIVAMGEESEIRLTDVGANDLAALRASLTGLAAAGPLNLSEGLRVAAQAALEPALEGDVARRVVVVTGGVERLDDATNRRVHQLLAALAEQKVACDFGDVSGYPGGHPLLAELARAAGGRANAIGSSHDLRWQLLESLTGTPSLVAADALLRVRFNPQAVAAWRLVGHEAGPTGGLARRAAESELRAGQSALLLYEVWLTGTSNDVATAEITWRDAASGEARRVVQPISRVQFAATWEETALPLQAAAIAAEAAEILRESYFASARNRVLAGVLDRADQVNRRLAARPDFQSFLAVLRAAEEIRSGRNRSGRSD